MSVRGGTAGSAPLRFTAAAGDGGERLDVAVARRLGVSRSQAQRWIRDRRVEVAGAAVDRPSRSLAPGEVVECRPEPEPAEPGLAPEAGPLSVLWEDEHLVVLDKAAGVAVHPGAGRASGTLANRLLARYPELATVGHPRRPGIVHRLDLGTTGVLAVARTDHAYHRLQRAFAAREVEKRYLAVVYGAPRPPSGEIAAGIARDPRHRTRMTVAGPGRRRRDVEVPTASGAPPDAVPAPRGRLGRVRPALTLYRLLADAGGLGLLELDLRTGRTHQIRVHLKSLGVPIVGDSTYGEARWRGFAGASSATLRSFGRPALHAWRLAFDHPASGERVAFEAPFPADLRTLWRKATGTEPPAALG